MNADEIKEILETEYMDSMAEIADGIVEPLALVVEFPEFFECEEPEHQGGQPEEASTPTSRFSQTRGARHMAFGPLGKLDLQRPLHAQEPVHEADNSFSSSLLPC